MTLNQPHYALSSFFIALVTVDVLDLARASFSPRLDAARVRSPVARARNDVSKLPSRAHRSRHRARASRRASEPTRDMMSSRLDDVASVPSAVDRAIARARARADEAERALRAKISRSMRDVTNGNARRVDEGRRSLHPHGDSRATRLERSGEASSERRARESVGTDANASTRAWMEDVVARASAEASRAEVEGRDAMRARGASTARAVLRERGRERERDGDGGMMDASPRVMDAASGRVSGGGASPRYSRADVEAMEATLRTDYENAMKLTHERAEAAEREVVTLTARCHELESARRSARNALAEMASQNAKLVNAFATKKEEVKALRESAEASTAQEDTKAQMNELREALASARADARSAREMEAIRKRELDATRAELEELRLKSRGVGNDESSALLKEKLASVMKELEREREAFTSQKASWRQERAKLVRLAADYTPRKSTPPKPETQEKHSSPKSASTPPKSRRMPSRSPKRATPPKPKVSPARQQTLPRKSPSLTKRNLHELREEAEQLKVRGNKAFHTKDYDAALQAYTDALSVDFVDDPFRAVLYANKAAALQAMGKYCDAVMECCISRTFDNSYIRALQRRADAYLSMGDWQMAMKDLEELLPHMGEDCELKLREAKRKVQNGCTSCEHYSVLGVRSSATKADVTKAYKSLALKFHPDKAPSDAVRPASEALFKRIAEAYATLKDSCDRAAYDASLAASRMRRTTSMP